MLESRGWLPTSVILIHISMGALLLDTWELKEIHCQTVL
jgi:hypothetical protein